MYFIRIDYFNPLPREEGDFMIVLLWLHLFNFNPLPREEGDKMHPEVVEVPADISIHSLVKRETAFGQGETLAKHISIHSLVKRETQLRE